MKRNYSIPPNEQKLLPPPMPKLLLEMAVKSYQPAQPLISEEETFRQLWEDMARRLDRSELRVASINYNILKSQTLTNKSA